MAKYRKKPVVVEAEQWDGNHHIGGLIYGDTCYDPYIQTLEGKMHVSPGDWIITGITDEKYPCKPDIFEVTYERVSRSGQPLIG